MKKIMSMKKDTKKFSLTGRNKCNFHLKFNSTWVFQTSCMKLGYFVYVRNSMATQKRLGQPNKFPVGLLCDGALKAGWQPQLYTWSEPLNILFGIKWPMSVCMLYVQKVKVILCPLSKVTQISFSSSFTLSNDSSIFSVLRWAIQYRVLWFLFHSVHFLYSAWSNSCNLQSFKFIVPS